MKINYLFLLTSIAILFFSCSPVMETEKQITQEEILEIKNYKYGIMVDSLVVIQDQIRQNEVLGSILGKYNIDAGTVHRIAEMSKEVFDVRRMRAGRPYAILATRDSIAQWFIYEASSIDYYVFDFRNPEEIEIFAAQKDVETREKEAFGTINNSLYLSLRENDADPALAILMSEIYAWTIDFHRIQKGDRFKVIYEQKYVDDQPVGLGEIKSVYFYHRGQDLYAFRYDQDGEVDYFDENGDGIKRFFLAAPVQYSRISSRFSPNRRHPVLGTNRPHLGTDYAAPHGTPIVSTADGVIERMGYTRGNGNYIKVKHNSVYSTQYLHMSRFAQGMRRGRRVSQGEVIGFVGSTGLATGPHVCYRFWKNGQQVDPFREVSPPSDPVLAENMEDFRLWVDKMMFRLNNLEVDEEPAMIAIF